jgi:uncharacterized protein with PhoU and TrkA domain
VQLAVRERAVKSLDACRVRDSSVKHTVLQPTAATDVFSIAATEIEKFIKVGIQIFGLACRLLQLLFF